MSVKEFEEKVIGLMREKKYAAALEAAREGLRFYPASSFLMRSELFALLKAGRTDEAKALADERYDRLKGHPFFLRTYLEILDRREEKDEALRFVEAVAAGQPAPDAAFFAFAARTYRRLFGKERALRLLASGLGRYAGDGDLGRLKTEWEAEDESGSGYGFYKEKFRGKDPIEAIAELERLRAVPSYASDVGLHLYLAGLYKLSGDFPKAIEAYRSALALEDGEFSRKMLGYLYYKTGDYENALPLLKEFFLKNPDDYYLSSAVNKMFEKRFGFGKYKILIKEVLALHPESKRLYGLLRKAEKWKN